MRGCSAYEGGVWFGAFIEEAGAQVGCDDAVRMMGQIHGQHVLETRAHTHTHTITHAAAAAVSLPSAAKLPPQPPPPAS